MHKKYKLLLFDLDGTLIDSKQDIAQATNAARAVLGLSPLPADTIASFVGSGMTELLEKAFHTQDKKIIKEGLEFFQKYYYDHCLDQTIWYPGVEDGLLNLKKAYPLVVLTNKPKEFTKKILASLKGEEWFRETLSGNEAFPKKPDPAGALYLAQKFGVALHECLLVGDSRFDIQTAVNADMDMALASYGFGWDAKGDTSGVTTFLKKFSDLFQFLESN